MSNLMTYHELRLRIKTEDPLDLSIEKWERLLDPANWSLITRNSLGDTTCGLCFEHFNPVAGCCKCPLKSRNQYFGCHANSYWGRVSKAFEDGDKAGFMKHGTILLNKLRSYK